MKIPSAFFFFFQFRAISREDERGGSKRGTAWGKYSRTQEKYQDSNRDVIAPYSALESPAEFHFLRAKNHHKRATGDTNSLHLSFKLDFSSAISAARALGLHSEPPRLWSGPADRFGMECSTYFLSYNALSCKNPSPAPSTIPGRISATLLNLHRDESMANLRERRQVEGGKGCNGTKPKWQDGKMLYYRASVVMKLPGTIASEHAIKNKLYLPRFPRTTLSISSDKIAIKRARVCARAQARSLDLLPLLRLVNNRERARVESNRRKLPEWKNVWSAGGRAR